MDEYRFPIKSVTVFLVSLIFLPFLLPSSNNQTIFQNIDLFPTRRYLSQSILSLPTTKPNIDFLFVGGSVLEDSIQSKMIEDYFVAQGKPIKTFTATVGSGVADAYSGYLIAKHFIENSQVKVILFDLTSLSSRPSMMTALDFNKMEIFPALPHMNTNDILTLWGLAILAGPIRLRHLAFPPSEKTNRDFAQKLEEFKRQNGSVQQTRKFNSTEPFQVTKILPSNRSAKDLMSSDNSGEQNRYFDDRRFGTYFFKKLAILCHKNKVKLYLVSSPNYEGDPAPIRHEFVAQKGEETLPRVPTIDISQKDLFMNYPQEEIKLFYRGLGHFNALGGQLYTRTILPALAKILSEINEK